MGILFTFSRLPFTISSQVFSPVVFVYDVQSGFSPLHIAAHYGNVSVARLLIQHGADVNRRSDKVRQTAVYTDFS